MINVILDTNFLIYCSKEKFDYNEAISQLINEGYNLVVPKQVIEELITVSKKPKLKISLLNRTAKFKKTTGKDKEAANLALKLLEANKVKVIEPVGDTVDDAIVNCAKENKDNIVATLDREMRKNLGRVILISKGHKLMLTR